MDLKERRDELDKSTRAVGSEVGVAHTTILDWEEKNEVPSHHREAMAKALRVSVDEIPGPKIEADYVRTKAQQAEWMRAVLESDQTEDVRFVLAVIGAYWDSDYRDVSIDQNTLENRAGAERVASCWDDVLKSPWVERRGRARWTFLLRRVYKLDE